MKSLAPNVTFFNVSLTLMPAGAVIRQVHCRLLGYKPVKLGLDKEPGTEPSILMSLLSAVQLGSEFINNSVKLFFLLIDAMISIATFKSLYGNSNYYNFFLRFWISNLVPRGCNTFA